MEDMAQFVSDYWQMCKDNEQPRPSAKEVAEAWLDHTDLPGHQLSVGLIDQIAYYLPASARRS